jgi:hypothetical protein
MKITINTDILQREHIPLGDFLVLLIGYYNVDYKGCRDYLVSKGIANNNVFDNTSIVLSDNSRNLVAKILVESDDRVIHSNIDFTELATKLQAIYPAGNKPGTSYKWRGETEEIVQKLQTLVALFDFAFTEEEAIGATKRYVESFKDAQYMSLLKYFILKTNKESHDVSSMFMTLIETNRDESNIE